MENKEFTKSIRKKIERRKKYLNLDTELLYIDSLKKYADLNEYKHPKKALRSYIVIDDVHGRFKNIKKINKITISKYSHVYDSILKEVSQAILKDVNNYIKENENYIDGLNRYINEKSEFKNLNVSLCGNSDVARLIECVLQKKDKKFTATEDCFLSFTNKTNNKERTHYFAANVVVHPDLEREFTFSRLDKYYSIKDVYRTVALSYLTKYVYNYIYNNKEIYLEIEKQLEDIYELTEEDKKMLSSFTQEDLLNIVAENEYYLPNIFKVLFTLSISRMLKSIIEIKQYEKSIKEINSNYAKTYMTKKNIPKKILNFMEDNKFLRMFGFVEADADSDLEKLRKLEDEFVSLSKQMPLVVSKDHSFRFRKLGNINRGRGTGFNKTGGVYYPGHNTVAVDLDSVNSFVHEYFHSIDYSNDILSLTLEFDSIVQKYRECMDEYVIKQGEDSEIFKEWFNSKSKYGRSYYRDSQEIFARSGEIYTQEILGIHSSFNVKDLSEETNEVAYPINQELLEMIKKYFDDLFEKLKNTHEFVNFDKDEDLKKLDTPLFDFNHLYENETNDEVFAQMSIWNIL